MQLKRGSVTIAVLWMILVAVPVTAQEEATCPDLVQTAYETTQTSCDETGRDEACYGNTLVSAEPQPDIDDFQFAAPGDVAGVSEIAALRLSAMDLAAEAWGMSLIRIRADLPDISSNYVELLLFGNVEIENRGGETAESGSEAPPYQAMQAFYFTSGKEDRPCEAAPDSGILIQTPEGEGEITVLVNEVVIELGSTAYVQAQPNDDMVISVIEGQATVTANGAIAVVPAGTLTTVPLDENGTASGTPTEPQPYDETALVALPIALLSRQIAIAPALVEGTGTSSTNATPALGTWAVVESCETVSTWASAAWAISVNEWNTEFTMTGDTLTIDWPSTISKAPGVSFTKNETGAFTYTESWADQHGQYVITQTVHSLSSEQMSGTSTWTLSTGDFPFMECRQEFNLITGTE